MKKFLLSILCCLMAVVNGYAEEKTKSVTFSSYPAGTQYAKNEKHVLGDGLVIYTTDCHFTTQLRIYSSASNNGYVVSDALPGTITKMTFNAGNKKDVLQVYGSNDGNTWTLVGEVNVTSTSYKDYSLTFTGNYSRFKLDVEGTNQIRLQSMSVTYSAPETPVAPNAPTLTESCSFYYAMNVEITNIPDSATVYYTTDETVPSASNGVVYTAPFEITATTTVKAVAVKDELESEVVSATYTKNVVPQGEVIDVLTRELTGVASGSNSYSSWSGKKSNSSAVYAGKSAGSYNAIQLRSKDSNEGIVTTVSGGKVKKIIIEWEGNTVNGRTLDIYGKNGAYTEPADLYKASEQGTKLGSIVKGTSTELEIKSDYTYIGLRSNSSAMYITSITIIWENESNEPASETWGSLYLPKAIDIPEGVKAYIITGAGSDYVSLTQITGALPANTGIIYNGAWTPDLFAEVVNDEVDVTGNLLEGSFVDTYIAEEAYVLAKVDGEVGFYKAQMNQLEGTAFLNNANKAYLPVSALPAAVQGTNGFKFRFETTGVEGVQVAQGKKVIFDLSGRKVNDMKAPGLYIVNGKKVLVK